MTDADDEQEPPVETRLEALAHRLDWIDRDRLGIHPKLWVWMAEQYFTAFGAIVLIGLLIGVSGIMPWDATIAWLDNLMSALIGTLAVLTFLARVTWAFGDRRDRSRENRSLIETSTEDDP
jgi:hypothetical protein